MGLPMALDHFYDTYNVDRPREDQELMPAVNTEAQSEGDTEGAQSETTNLHELQDAGLESCATDSEVLVDSGVVLQAFAADDKSLAKLQGEIRGRGSIAARWRRRP
jgi:hypothetical protein